MTDITDNRSAEARIQASIAAKVARQKPEVDANGKPIAELATTAYDARGFLAGEPS